MINPVLRREIKTSFRTSKTFYYISAYVFVLLLFTSLFMFVSISNSYNGFSPKNTLFLYLIMSGIQCIFIFLTVPAFTGSSISGERERQTLDLLLITKMSSRSIVIGKLMSSLIIVLLMITASMPVYAIIFYYGGVSLYGFIITILFSISNTMFIGSTAILFSSLFKKTIISIVLTYLVIFVLSFGLISVCTILYTIVEYKFNIKLPEIFYLIFLGSSPIIGFTSIIDNQLGTNVSWEIITSFSGNYNKDTSFIYVWHIHILINFVLTFIFINLAAMKINPVKSSKNKIKTKNQQNNKI